MKVQVKILYGPKYERCKTTVISKEEFLCMTLEELSSMVSEVVGGFFQGVKSRLRLQYCDDEGTYITMNDETDVNDAVRSSVPIPREDEVVRVCLKVDKNFTPTNENRDSPPKKRPCNLESKRKLKFSFGIETKTEVFVWNRNENFSFRLRSMHSHLCHIQIFWNF